MQRLLAILVVLTLAAPALADIPGRRLDGSFSKAPLYNDDYPYTPLDYAAADRNPLQVGVKRNLSNDGPEFTALTKQFEADRSEERQKAFRDKWVKTATKEFELTDKEKATVAAYPDEFPAESKAGKRIMTSEALRLGDKEYPCGGCRFLGVGDWNGDGTDELFLRYDDGATHAGASSQIRVFSANGDFVWYTNLMTLFMGWHGVADFDGDGRVELILDPGKPPQGMGDSDAPATCAWVLGCPAPGQTLQPYSGGRRNVPSPQRGRNLELGPGPDSEPQPEPGVPLESRPPKTKGVQILMPGLRPGGN